MVRISYKGGEYVGDVKVIKRTKANKGHKVRVSPIRVPHGFGKYTYAGVSFIGLFKDGYEHGNGVIVWPNGDSFVGNFKYGRPQATVLQFVEHSNKLERRLLNKEQKLFKASEDLELHQAHLRNLEQELFKAKEDLELEQEKNMDVALFVDNCQQRIEKLYNIALAAGADASDLAPLRYPHNSNGSGSDQGLK